MKSATKLGACCLLAAGFPAVLAGMGPSVETIEVELNVEAGIGSMTFDLPLDGPVTLDGVTRVALDTVIHESEGVGGGYETSVSFQLTAAGVNVTGIGGAGVFGDRHWASTPRRVTAIPARATFVDGFRIQTTVNSTGATSVALRLRGLHEGNRLRLHLIRGAYSVDGPNFVQTVRVPGQIRLDGPGVGQWIETNFNRPVPGTGLAFVHLGGFGWLWSGRFDNGQGSMVESEILLDDGSSLTMDDAFSPSTSEPAVGRIATGTSLRLSASQRELVRGRQVTGIRWRLVRVGGGFTRVNACCGQADILADFAYDYSDCNGNLVPDDVELAEGTLTDCDGDGTADACDPDCDGDGISDICALRADPSLDCNSNGELDRCEIGDVDLRIGQPIEVSPGTLNLALDDFDAQGGPDAVISQSSSVSILRGIEGPGLFELVETHDFDDRVEDLAVGDLEGDGDQDIIAVVDETTVGILRGRGDGTFELGTIEVSGRAGAVELGHFDADTQLDLVVVYRRDNSVGILSGDGAGGFGSERTLPVGESPRGLELVASGGGKRELVVWGGSTTEGYVMVIDITRQPELTTRTLLLDRRPAGVLLRQVSGGRELVVYTRLELTGYVEVGDEFEVAWTRELLAPISRAETVDLDGDGTENILLTSPSASRLTVLNDNNTVESSIIGVAPGIMAVGDIDGDGAADALVADNSSRKLWPIFNETIPSDDTDCNRDGRLDSCQIATGELTDDDGDGKADNCAPPTPSFRRGDCNASGMVDIADAVFTLETLFLGEGDPSCQDACDSNDDGAMDISDPINSLRVLFLGAGPIPAPGRTECGEDPTTDDALACESYDACP